MITSHTVRVATLLASLMAIPGLHAAEVAGVPVEERLKVGGDELVLNGAGLRSRLFVKVYVGALHVAQRSPVPASIIDSAAPRRMTMRLLRDIDADTLYGALRDGLRDNCSAAELADLQPQVDQFAGIMRRIGNARSGDTMALDFNAEGVAVSFNGEPRGKVAGRPFARALLQVWLGDKPVDASLKKALLGS
ncbi:MAG: putative lipoprotein transrane [Rhodocyclaceae bacterium]|nr:putative lipoprotein transrane [Rhodocyclaceae bacterium]